MLEGGYRTSFAWLFLSSALLATGCGVADNDPDVWDRARIRGSASSGAAGAGGESSSGAGTGSGEGGAAATGGNSTGSGSLGTGSGGPTNDGLCDFTYRITTVTYDGHYSPHNVGAIWIETAQGDFVRSLNVWGDKRLKNVTHWKADSASNEVDAITSATLSSHKTHSVSWDCTDLGGAPVPGGDYVLAEEFTEDNSAESFEPPTHFKTVAFTKGSEPQSLDPPDVEGFHGSELTYAPAP